MSQNEARSAFIKLTEILRLTGLSWLLDEANEEIRQGKPKEKRIRTRSDDVGVFAFEEAEPGRRKPSTFVESVEFTDIEKLEILIAAIERGAIMPALMEREIAALLKRARPNTGSTEIDFTFLSEDENEMRRTSTLEARSKRMGICEGLMEQLTRLKEIIRAPD